MLSSENMHSFGNKNIFRRRLQISVCVKVFQMILFILVKPVHSQDPPAGAPTTPSLTTATQVGQSADPPGSCPGSAQASPLTINNYGCGEGSPGGSYTDSSKEVEDELQGLKDRLGLLELQVQQLGGDGGGMTGGVFLPQRGDPARLGVRDCDDVRTRFGNDTNDVYVIWPPRAPTSFEVFCEFEGDNSYTVIQSRVDGSTNFQRAWNEYRVGFGSKGASTNMWLGLDNLHYITGLGPQYTLRVDLEDFDGQKRFAEYDYFSVGPESDRYRLKVFWYKDTSDGGDALGNYHNFIPFSAFDMDNDYAPQNCALEHGGGWWYRDCDNANLNGQYNLDPVLNGDVDVGIEWDTYRRKYSLKTTKMRIKRAYGR